MTKDIGKHSISVHRKLKGKIAVAPKGKLKSLKDLSVFYTPGVGAVSKYVAKHKKDARDYTIKGNSVAVVSDGSAVLGLGNIGPLGALPVMEGKAMIFKEFANIDAFPIVLGLPALRASRQAGAQNDKESIDKIVEVVKAIAPTFGGINLEDISAPRCFEIEERLKRELPIPVMHDDQHGTAIVALAGLINALKVAKKKAGNARVVIVGAGAAGYAIWNIFSRYGVGDIVAVDSKGIISKKRKDLNTYKKRIANASNKRKLEGGLEAAMKGADAVIGVSGPRKITSAHIRNMSEKPIVFALANPVPEIMPDVAERAGAYVIATGRSDFPNQINNALVFPGVFRGALDNRVRDITDEMKVRAAKKLASLIRRPTRSKLIPSVLDKRIVRAIASAIR